LIASILRYAEGRVEISAAKDLITIKADDLTAVFRGLIPPEDFPTMVADGFDAEKSITFAEAALHKAMGPVLVCISTEETRYYLNGIYFAPHPETKALRLVATDGHRLAVYDTDEAIDFGGAIVPRKTCHFLFSILSSSGNLPVRITPRVVLEKPAQSVLEAAVSGELPGIPRVAAIQIETEDWRILAKTIDGTYPDYRRVMPPESDAIAVTISDAALRRFPGSFEGNTTTCLKVYPDESYMEISRPDQITVRMPVQGRGPAFGVNIKYLRDFTRRAKTIRLEGDKPGDPLRVLTEDPRLTQVVMPMRV
jgi:DNA polymerase-3 subunit beta